jgi:hypothetical protein
VPANTAYAVARCPGGKDVVHDPLILAPQSFIQFTLEYEDCNKNSVNNIADKNNFLNMFLSPFPMGVTSAFPHHTIKNGGLNSVFFCTYFTRFSAGLSTEKTPNLDHRFLFWVVFYFISLFLVCFLCDFL